ncbi:MAG: phosphoglycolate phosphatase [Hyphomicrobiaceae bacterium]
MTASTRAAARWPRGLVFDLDGTLVDSVGDIAGALNAALADHALPALAVDDVRRLVGRGAEVTIQRALGQIGGGNRDVASVHRAFVRHYAAHPARQTVLYPGARELIDDLIGAGQRLAICTNKPEALTHVILDALGVTALFGAVIGESTRLPRKPDPAMLAAALDGIGVPADQGVMIGDSVTDVGTARALGIPIVLVSFGYTPVPARELGADAVIDHLSELPAALARLSGAA